MCDELKHSWKTINLDIFRKIPSYATNKITIVNRFAKSVPQVKNVKNRSNKPQIHCFFSKSIPPGKFAPQMFRHLSSSVPNNFQMFICYALQSVHVQYDPSKFPNTFHWIFHRKFGGHVKNPQLVDLRTNK